MVVLLNASLKFHELMGRLGEPMEKVAASSALARFELFLDETDNQVCRGNDVVFQVCTQYVCVGVRLVLRFRFQKIGYRDVLDVEVGAQAIALRFGHLEVTYICLLASEHL